MKGGADAAIRFGLRRLLELGYDFIGLIENDVLLSPGWLGAMRSCVRRRQPKMALRSEPSLRSAIKVACWSIERIIRSTGRAVLRWCFLRREAAQLLLENYSRLEMTSQQIRGFYAEHFGVALHVPEWAVGGRWMDGPMTLDWGYAPLLYANGYACVGTIPSLARDLEFDVRTVLRTDYVRAEQNASGLSASDDRSSRTLRLQRIARNKTVAESTEAAKVTR